MCGHTTINYIHVKALIEIEFRLIKLISLVKNSLELTTSLTRKRFTKQKSSFVTILVDVNSSFNT